MFVGTMYLIVPRDIGHCKRRGFGFSAICHTLTKIKNKISVDETLYMNSAENNDINCGI